MNTLHASKKMYIPAMNCSLVCQHEEYSGRVSPPGQKEFIGVCDDLDLGFYLGRFWESICSYLDVEL